MSTQAALPDRSRRVGPRLRVLCWVITAVARGVARLPPQRIRSLLTVLSAGARPAGHAEALAARDAVTAVSLRCAGPGCLPRSIATALLCRVKGSWPTWRVGVRTAPFSAHAWVEAEGRPVGEPPGTELLHVLMTVRPAPRPARHHRP
ncbi:lasso peptide biosynthesis B2 protein [Saccharothrix hoggarensis]|uniref:Lasso peptide biosynthesis B2 protein n=1 Tax=Saccharothrix hoggarensis TaxID=913853 RepID=A0ABW3QVV1_9PSEU